MTKTHIKANRVFANLIKHGHNKLTQQDFERIRKAEAEASGIEYKHRDCRGTILRVGDIVTFAASANPNCVFNGTIEVLCPNNTKRVTVKIPGKFPKTIPTDWIIADRTMHAERMKKDAATEATAVAA